MKAAFCLATGISPSEYEALTQVEIRAFIETLSKARQ